MKHHYTSSKTILALVFGLGATVASANVSGVSTSVGAVGGVTGNLGGQLGGASSAPGAAFGGSAVGAAGVGGIDGPRGFDGTLPTAHVSGAFESIGMRQARLMGEGRASAHSALVTERESAVVPLPNEQAASAVLTTGFSAQTIREASVDEREQLAASINKRIDTSSEAMATLKRDSKSVDGETKGEFKAALKDVDAREKELKTSLKAARKASAETWSENRADVAARYDAYEQSVARAESVIAARNGTASEASATSAVGGNVSTTTSSNRTP